MNSEMSTQLKKSEICKVCKTPSFTATCVKCLKSSTKSTEETKPKKKFKFVKKDNKDNKDKFLKDLEDFGYNGEEVLFDNEGVPIKKMKEEDKKKPIKKTISLELKEKNAEKLKKKNAEKPKEKKSKININMFLKSENHTLEFTEKINVDRAKIILKMNTKQLIDEVYDKDEKNENGIKYSEKERDNYIKQIKNYCRLAIANNGVINQGYKYSKHLQKNQVGRIYVNQFGIQSLQTKIRGYLGGEYTKDLDMKNAFPTLLLWLMEKHFPSVEIRNLKKYVSKRDTLLKKYDTCKIDVLCWLHRDFKYNGSNVLLKCLDQEFKIIQDTLWNDSTNTLINLVDKKSITSTNKKGSLLNRVLGIIENEILQYVIPQFEDKISVPYYDGLWIDKSINTEETIEKLNTLTEDWGVKWDMKEHSNFTIDNADIEEDDDELIIDDILEEKLYGYDYIEYDDLKAKFEKNHAVIQAPFLIVREYEDYYSYKDTSNKDTSKKTLNHELYSVSNLKELYANLYYHEKEQKNIGTPKKPQMVEIIIKKLFVDMWLRDENRRTLKKIDFMPESPINKIAPKNIYNLFDGYKAKLPKEGTEYDFDVDAEVQRFINHLSLLTNHHEEGTNYLINYIADLLQNPQNLPSVALVFKSKQGLGKDLLINYIEKLIGEKYVYRTSNMEEIYGTFNPAVKGKLLVQLNELEGKDGFAKKERLKDSITAESVNINEKNIKPFRILHAIRYLIFSNNMNPIDIPADDRRFVVYQGGDLLDEKDRDEYYNPLFDNLDNHLVINKLLEYFMNIDLSDFNLKRQRPITDAYKQMRENCIPPMYKFTWDLLNDLFKSGDTKIRKHNKLNKSIIKSTDFHNLYSEWYNKVLKTDTTLNFKTLKPMLNNINMVKKEVRLNSYKDYYYIFDADEVIKKLTDEHKCGADDEEVLELDDDFDEEDLFLDTDLDLNLDSNYNGFGDNHN